MLIHGASLVNRFYVRDGWTQKAVAELLDKPDIKYVEGRYAREKDIKYYGEQAKPLTPDLPIQYFAVYNNIFPDVYFLKEKIAQHEYQSYADEQS